MHFSSGRQQRKAEKKLSPLSSLPQTLSIGTSQKWRGKEGGKNGASIKRSARLRTVTALPPWKSGFVPSSSFLHLEVLFVHEMQWVILRFNFTSELASYYKQASSPVPQSERWGQFFWTFGLSRCIGHHKLKSSCWLAYILLECLSFPI